MNRPKETYLGNGIYISHDGSTVKLRAPRDGGDSVIYLEPHIWRALMSYVEALQAPSEQDAERVERIMEQQADFE